jgi:O-antigen ligase
VLRPGGSRAARLLWGGTVAILLAGLLLTSAGRSGFVVIGVSAVVALLAVLRAGHARRWTVVAGLAVLAVLMALSPMVADRFAQGWNEVRNAGSAVEPTSMGARVAIWSRTVDLIGEAPVLGHGTGSFTPAYQRMVQNEPPGWRARPSEDPHNQYLYFLAETGVLGLAAFLWWLAAALRQPAPAMFRVAGVALLLSWCVTSLFSSHFKAFNEGHMIMIFLGVLLAREADIQVARTASTAPTTSS